MTRDLRENGVKTTGKFKSVLPLNMASISYDDATGLTLVGVYL